MLKGYFFKTIAVFTISVVCVMVASLGCSFFFKKSSYAKRSPKVQVRHIAQVSIDPVFSQLISLEIRMEDTTPSSKEGSLADVYFNQEKVFLKPSDPMGDRGRAYFRLRPGTYQIRWSIYNDKENWPRTTEYRHEIILKKTDQWRYILIHGKTIQIR